MSLLFSTIAEHNEINQIKCSFNSLHSITVHIAVAVFAKREHNFTYETRPFLHISTVNSVKSRS